MIKGLLIDAENLTESLANSVINAYKKKAGDSMDIYNKKVFKLVLYMIVLNHTLLLSFLYHFLVY